MCLNCYKNYFNGKIEPAIDPVIFNIIINEVRQGNEECQGSLNFMTFIGRAEQKFRELGFICESANWTTLTSNLDTYTSSETSSEWETDPEYEELPTFSGQFESGFNGEINLLINRQFVNSVFQETIKLEPPQLVAKSIVDCSLDLEEMNATISKIFSKFRIPITSSQKHWYNQIFNAIPFYHHARLSIIKQALKILNMVPSEFKRQSDRSITLTKEAFVFFKAIDHQVRDETKIKNKSKQDENAENTENTENAENTENTENAENGQDLVSLNEECGLCYQKLIEVSPSFQNGSETNYLYCGGRFKNPCQHKFCYSCYRQLQSTLLGDYCPSCRSALKEKTIIPVLRLRH